MILKKPRLPEYFAWNFDEEITWFVACGQKSSTRGSTQPVWLGLITNEYSQFYKVLFIFRDNGITIQILTYQVCVELFLFLPMVGYFFFPIDFEYTISFPFISIFAMFVILPLFYLNGDANFRNRVLHQGLWTALKQELFQTNTSIHPIR